MSKKYPPSGFHFEVEFEGLSSGSNSGFQEVSGLEVSIDTFSYEEGGENRFVHRLPERVSYGNLVLKRGLLKGSELIEWFRNAVELYRFKPTGVLVTLLNENHEPLESWSFIQAYPVKWAVSEFNATGNEIVAETIELSYQYFRRLEKGADSKLNDLES